LEADVHVKTAELNRLKTSLSEKGSLQQNNAELQQKVSELSEKAAEVDAAQKKISHYEEMVGKTLLLLSFAFRFFSTDGHIA
jgi:hypothetical protein